ncbi:MAG: LuxR C-terminal-related transcriptional regulator, partial [Thiohalocapsa sp.]
MAAFEEAMTLVPQHSVGYLRGDAKLLLVLSLYVCGRGQDAGRSINAELEQGSPPEYMVRSRMIYGQAAIRLLSGELNRVSEPARSLIESAQRIGAQMVEAWGHYFLGIAAFHSGKLEFAQRQFSQVANMRYIAHAKAAIDSIAGLAIISQLLARPDEADEALRLAHELAKQIKDPGLKDIVNACQARIALLRGDLESAMRWQRSFTESTPVAMMFLFLENPGLTECRILIATASQASLRKVSCKLKQLRTAVETRRYTGQLIEILALQALAAEAQARREDALTILIEAVRMAAPGGWIRPFTEPGKPMITLLNALLARSPNNDAPVRRLMDAVMASTQADETGATYTLASQGCTDSAIAQGLTEREWDILPLIAQRLQNKEIANLLDVSPETIKTHLKN